MCGWPSDDLGPSPVAGALRAAWFGLMALLMIHFEPRGDVAEISLAVLLR